MERNGFLATFLLDEQQARASLLRFEDGERRLTNLFISARLHETATEQRLNQQRWPVGWPSSVRMAGPTMPTNCA